jgi:restriction endonuclease S subunit
MAVWSIIKLSGLGGAFRLDPEFWRPEYLRVERAIKKLPHKKLGDLALSLRKGVFNILAESYVETGVPFYRSSNVGAIVPKTSELVYISEKQHASEHKTALKRGDIMLAKTGKEAASVVLVDDCNVSQDVVALRPDRKQINPFYLAVFLNTEPGVLQMRRWFQGQVQMHLSLPDTREILVPIPEPKAQKEIEALVVASEASNESAHAAIAAAETRLMDALGLDRPDLWPQKCYTRRLRDLEAEARFDAEYFNPKYQRIIKKLRAGGRTLADVAPLAQRPFDPALRPKGSTFRYIEIGSLTGDGEAEAETLDVADAPSRAAWIVKPGDVITSTVRPIRRLSALVRDNQDGCVCSSGFACLTPKSGAEGIEPEVLLTYLRLPIICEILDLHCTASMYPAIPEDRLMRIPIIVPDTKTRKAVVAKVQDAMTARAEAARLLDQAKKTVEGLIAEGGSGKGR